MAHANLETTGNSIILDTRLWMGTSNESTAWLSGIAGVGAGQAEGGTNILIVDLNVDQENATTTLDLALGSTIGLPKLDATAVVAVLSVTNITNAAYPPAEIAFTGATASFKTFNNAAVDNDIHRVTLLYR